MERSRLVYSTELGRICPDCGRPVDECVCPKGRRRAGAAGGDAARSGAPVPGGRSGVVRVRRETKGRAGKTATTVSDVPLSDGELEELAGRLKRKLGTGGGVRDGVIVIQGDHVTALMSMLTEMGYTVRKSGG